MLKQLTIWFFSRPPQPPSALKTIAWWEKRRPLYNFIIAIVGIISLFCTILFMHLAHELKPGRGAIKPIALFIVLIAMNIAYTAGWVAELLLNASQRKSLLADGPILLKLGLGLSILVAFVPTLASFAICIVRTMQGTGILYHP